MPNFPQADFAAVRATSTWFSCSVWCSWVRERKVDFAAVRATSTWFSCSVWCSWVRDYHFQRDVLPDALCDRKIVREKLWREFFSDPSQWWDHRLEKSNPRYPDFKHKTTGLGLWLVDRLTPSWVEAKLVTMPPALLRPHIFSWNVRLRRHVKDHDYKKTFDLFQQMQREGLVPDKFTFVPVLIACSNLSSLDKGRRVHKLVIHKGCDSDIYVATCLVDMYAKCGSIEDAWSVFKDMRERDVVSWNAIIGGYVKSDQSLKALELFHAMQQEGAEPDAVTFLGALNACASLEALTEGRRVHEQIIRRGYESDIYVANCLVDMYAKCGSIEDAWNVFIRMPERNVISWTAMIVGYVKSEEGLKALNLFRKMQQEGVEPDAITFLGALNACANLADLEEGRRVHQQINLIGCESDAYVATCLVDMYAKCGSIENAWSVFDKMRQRNVVSWNALIGGYVKSDHGLEAMELFRKMQQEGVEPDAGTFVEVLNACANLAALEEGRRVHQQIIRSGCENVVYVATGLVHMYSKCGSIGDAWIVFNKMRERDAVSWSTMIVGYAKSGQSLKALGLFQAMQQEGLEPDAATFIGALNACASIAALEEGRRLHEQISRRGFDSDVYVANCLVDMYAKCRSIEDAWSMFKRMQERNVFSWNAMIGAYVNFEPGLKALELFQEMQQERVEPNTVSFVGVLNACASVAALEEGRCIHEQIICRGCESDVYVSTCLVDMYAKCGSIEDAWSVFKKMRERDVVSWSAMIIGYVKCKQGLKALELFRKMQSEGVDPNTVTLVGVLNACASVVSLEEGRRVHEHIIGRGYETEVHVTAGLIDMYAKCGSIEDACTVFNKIQELDVVSWNAMIEGYAKHGHSDKAIELFERMGKEGLEINHVTFTCILSACNHGGLVEEGLRYFNTMTSHYNVLPTGEHCACMVDLLGRAGRIEEAEKLIMRMPIERNSSVLKSLLGACRIHGNVEIAEWAAKRCWELDPENASALVLLSNIYAAAGQ